MKQAVREWMKQAGKLPVLVPRLLAAWFVTGLWNTLSSEEHFTLEALSGLSGSVLLVRFLLAFAVFCIVGTFTFGELDMIALGVASAAYSVRLLTAQNDIYTLFGVCLFQALYCYYYEAPIRSLLARVRMGKRAVRYLMAACILSITVTVIWLTVCRYRLSRSTTFDMGIFSQMFYSMKENLSMVTTCERNRFLSHLHVHTSLFYYLLLPFYWLAPTPETLLVLQAGAVAVGFVPFTLLMRHFGFSGKAMLAFGVIYAFSPATWGGCFYDFHENVFLIPTLLFLFYHYEKGEYGRMLLSAMLVCSVKEDAPLFVIVFGMYVLFGKKEGRAGISLLALGVAWMSAAFCYLAGQGEGLMTGHYGNLTADGTVPGILRTLLTNPGYLLTQMLNAEKVAFLIAVFVPVTVLPFLTRKYSRFFLFLPFVFINLLPTDVYMYSVFYQYVFAPYMFLLYLAMLNARDMRQRYRKFFLFAGTYLTLFVFVSHISQKTYYYRMFEDSAYDRACIGEMIEALPEEASISASTFFVPQLSQRKEIYMLDDKIVGNGTVYETDYAVFDLRPGFANEQVEAQIALYRGRGYVDERGEESVYLILSAKGEAGDE